MSTPNITEASIASFLTGAVTGLRQRLACSVFANVSDNGIVQITAFPKGNAVTGRGSSISEALAQVETQLQNAPRIAELKNQLRELEGGAA